ncbi:MAG: hypothetical protein ABIN68_02680 [Sphingomicrobium sp.]
MRAALLLGVLAMQGCATGRPKAVRFVEYPYCAVLADGVRYRFHAGPRAAAMLSAAAERWPAHNVRLTSDNRGVEKDCLDRVVATLRRAGKRAEFVADN